MTGAVHIKKLLRANRAFRKESEDNGSKGGGGAGWGRNLLQLQTVCRGTSQEAEKTIDFFLYAEDTSLEL